MHVASQVMSETPIGLIAGWGSFPIEVAAALKAAGHPVYCVAITDHASAKLESICDAVLWTGVGKLGRYIRFFRRHLFFSPDESGDENGKRFADTSLVDRSRRGRSQGLEGRGRLIAALRGGPA